MTTTTQAQWARPISHPVPLPCGRRAMDTYTLIDRLDDERVGLLAHSTGRGWFWFLHGCGHFGDSDAGFRFLPVTDEGGLAAFLDCCGYSIGPGPGRIDLW